ncbi:exodeoxyribonuclease VII large subunit [Tautonia rosea]|uniref:exodeoxyribonuclease VII large subunit n=1 Tax=Tautonia rosea TaxID=2728037 RepID=UPI00147668FE|nr:exodeoxyribonuclease VII large subunit [Tautonia rosea]
MPGPSLFDSLPDPHDRDPKATAGGVGLPSAPPVLSVTELTSLIRELLESAFAEVAVCGEISNLSRPKSGHVYFDIKDEGARIRAVLWRTQAARVPFDLENGLAVRAWGSVDLYPPHGSYQINVRTIEPEGIGPLELAFRQLCDRLRIEGLFDPARKRPLPKFPRRIVVVSSPTGAAVRDILTITGRRWPSAEILIAPAKVQGQGAAEEVAAAIAMANRLRQVDLILVGRGGGSLEDLWAFNEEVVARAIVASRVPIVSGVGHETDLTIADLVADLRGPTPSGAAELAVPDARDVLDRLETLSGRMARALALRSSDARSRLESLADRSDRAMARLLDRRRDRLAALAGQLDALSPLAVLSRGYSLTQRLDDGRVVRAPDDARPGTVIRTRLASGSILSRVEASPTDGEPAHDELNASSADTKRPARRDRRPAPGAAAPVPTDRPRKRLAPGGSGPFRTDPERS